MPSIMRAVVFTVAMRFVTFSHEKMTRASNSSATEFFIIRAQAQLSPTQTLRLRTGAPVTPTTLMNVLPDLRARLARPYQHYMLAPLGHAAQVSPPAPRDATNAAESLVFSVLFRCTSASVMHSPAKLPPPSSQIHLPCSSLVRIPST